MASISKRGNTYRVQVFAGRDASGKMQRESATFIPDPQKTEKQNQKALELFAMDFERRIKNEKYLDGEKITFKEFSDVWLRDYAADRLAASTIQMYKDLLQVHILPAIGNLKLSKVQPRTLNSLYATLLKTQKANGKGTLSAITVKHVHATISTIYRTAVKWNVCLDNPCERTEPPRMAQNGAVKLFYQGAGRTLLCSAG